MKKRILTILALIALVLIPFKNVYAEELNDAIGIEPNANEVSDNETVDESSNEEESDEVEGETEPQTVEPAVLAAPAATNDADEEPPVLRSTMWYFDIQYDANGGTTGENWRDSERVWKNMWTQSKDIYISIDPEVITAPEGYVFAGLEIDGETYLVGGDVDYVTVRDDATVKYLWNQLITEVEITLTQPFVGETNDMEQDEEGYWDWSSQTNPPVAEVAEDAPYTVEYTYWIMGWHDEEYDTPFVGTFERDTEYHAEIVLYTTTGYEFAEDVVVTVNGEPIDEIIYRDYYYNDEDMPIAVMSVGKLVTPFEYLIIDGDNQTHRAYKDGDLVVTSNGNAEDLVELRVDNNTLDPSNYTIESGSTIATLKAEYLDELDAGTHLLTFVYPKGEVSANFEVVKTNNPQTADIIQVWFVLALISIMGMGFTVVQLRKNN